MCDYNGLAWASQYPVPSIPDVCDVVAQEKHAKRVGGVAADAGAVIGTFVANPDPIAFIGPAWADPHSSLAVNSMGLWQMGAQFAQVQQPCRCRQVEAMGIKELSRASAELEINAVTFGAFAGPHNRLPQENDLCPCVGFACKVTRQGPISGPKSAVLCPA
ncbi:MAG: hypothetical protein IPP14_05875 [Planctomycetes bacterium]|nr:hypothetical protein [Planctomycetota bacterium]